MVRSISIFIADIMALHRSALLCVSIAMARFSYDKLPSRTRRDTRLLSAASERGSLAQQNDNRLLRDFLEGSLVVS